MPTPHIYLVDDDPGALRSLAFLLERYAYAVTPLASPTALLNEDSLQRPACLITDYRMPEMTGLDLFRQLQARGTPLPTIIVTAFGDIPTCSFALRSGVLEFLEKPAPEAALLSAVTAALDQSSSQEEKAALQLRQLCEKGKLTPREAAVLSLVVRGQTLKQIAREFGTTIQTVSKQRLKLYDKLGVTSSVELMHRLLAG